MTNHSESPYMVRVTRFKTTGKYYDEFALNMSNTWECITPIHAVIQALDYAAVDEEYTPEKRVWFQSICDRVIRDDEDWEARTRASSFMLFVYEPYHRNPYPVVVHLD